MDKIDWDKRARYVIRRVYERGNEKEKKEITRFYGSEKVVGAMVWAIVGKVKG
jgi:hypothetical protein